MKQNRVIGITGGSGSGKSTVSRIFEEFGAFIIDADKISHQLTDSDEVVLARIKEAFTEKVFENGVLSRKALAEIVFSDKNALKTLNGIVHPAVAEKTLEMIEKCGKELVIIDAPLLFDVKEIAGLCDETIAVCAPDEMRINRIMDRDGISYEMAQKRINSQRPQEELARLADRVIVNDGDPEKLRSDVIGYLGK